MDAPPIQYARTSDGVNIAYWREGSGPHLVMMPFGPSLPMHQVIFPEERPWRERLSAHRTLVRFDGRGTGLSDRKGIEASLATAVSDLEAVVDDIGLDSFDLLAPFQSGPPAIHYAASNPARVSRLLFWCAYARYADLMASPLAEAMVTLRAADWETYTIAIANVVFGRTDSDRAATWAAWIRSVTSREEYEALLRTTYNDDATDLLGQVKSPTLVLHARDCMVDPAAARALASGIGGARLIMLDGANIFPWFNDADAMLHATESFLADEADADQTDVGAQGFRTILFTDLESSTALTQKLGDDKAQEILRGHNAIVRKALDEHAGSEVKHTGDGIMASFTSAVSAVQAALQIQRDLAGSEIRVRIGLNAGEPIAEDHDYFGTAVQLAARLCDRAEPGQVLVSNVVRELCAGKTFRFEDVGAATLKGFDEPVALYAVEGRQ